MYVDVGHSVPTCMYEESTDTSICKNTRQYNHVDSRSWVVWLSLIDSLV